MQSSRSHQLRSFKQMALTDGVSLSLLTVTAPLVKARKAHQPLFTSRAIRQVINVLPRLKPILPVRKYASEPCLGATETETPSDVRHSLLQRLRSIVTGMSHAVALVMGVNVVDCDADDDRFHIVQPGCRDNRHFFSQQRLEWCVRTYSTDPFTR